MRTCACRTCVKVEGVDDAPETSSRLVLQIHIPTHACRSIYTQRYIHTYLYIHLEGYDVEERRCASTQILRLPLLVSMASMRGLHPFPQLASQLARGCGSRLVHFPRDIRLKQHTQTRVRTYRFLHPLLQLLCVSTSVCLYSQDTTQVQRPLHLKAFYMNTRVYLPIQLS